MWVLTKNLAMQKSVKALTEGMEICSNYEYWIIIAWLSLILLGIKFLIIEKVHKMPIFRKHQYSNTIKVLIFISNIKSCRKFQEDVYMHTFKYRRWKNQLRPFRSLKKRVANIFRKRNCMSHDSRGTSTQFIVNSTKRDSKERSVKNKSERSSVHSNWSDLVLIDMEAEYWRIYNSRKKTLCQSAYNYFIGCSCCQSCYSAPLFPSYS